MTISKNELNFFIFALLTLIFFSGCATKMSLEEAKKVSISMEEMPAFTPPPRRINDIMSVLDQPGQFESRITAKFKVQADAKPPDTKDPRTLKGFYMNRGGAAFELNRLRQARDDLQRALAYEIKDNSDGFIKCRLGIIEHRYGNFQKAVALYKESSTYPAVIISLYDTGSSPMRAYLQLVGLYATIGDLEAAKSAQQSGVDFSRHDLRRSEGRFMHEEMLHLMDAFILEAQGSYTEAESEYRKIKSLGLGPGRVFLEKYPASFISVDMYHARNLLNQQRLMEAEVESRKALMASLAHAGKESALTGQALTLLTRIIQAQGRLEEAERLSDAAIRILEVAGTPADSYLMGLARVTKGDILAATEDYTGAMTQYDLARAGMKENKFLYERSFMQNPMMALSMLMTGRYNEAGSLASQGYNNYQKRFGERHENTAEMLALRGMAQERVNHLREAVQDLSAATDILMQARTEEGEFARHKKLRRVIIDDYIGLLAKIHGTSIEKELGIDAIAVSFKMAEANRSRSVQGALVASGARAAVTDRELAELIRREQDADRQIFTMESSILDLMASPSGQQDSKAIQKLRSDVENLRRARDSFLNETKKRFPRYADFVNPSPSTIPYIQGVLRSGEVLLSLYTTKDQTFVWAIPQQGRILFHAATLGRKDLGKIVQDLRKSLDVNPNTLGDIPDFDTSLAYHLYAELIKPIEMGWKSATELIVVASGPLGQIPLDLLPTDRVNPRVEKDLLFSRYRSIPWLIRKVSVTSVPSVSSLVSLRTVPAGDPKRKAFVGFGDPVFSKAQMAKIPSQLASVDTLIEKGKGTMPLIASRGMKVKVRGIRISEKGNLDKQEITSSQLSQLQRLPDTAEEIRSIAQVLNADMERDVFLGKEATKHRIKTMDLTDRKIIAFATHALVPGDLDGLDEPALALSSPEVTGDKEDGLLTMGEIMKLKLNADWVILSACNSGASNGAGQEAISGLGRAFFYAGTRSLLVTLWPVETTSAKKLVTGIFKAQKTDDTLSRSQALRKSMLHLMDDESFVDETTGKIAASYAHPLFWAPFIIVGDPGGN